MNENDVLPGYVEKDYEELTITDNFLFGKIMRNPRLCKKLLEIILDIEIERIEYPETEKNIDIVRDAKSIRLDVYVSDDKGSVYNVEMQATANENLPKRSRYYQGMIDLNLIEKGADYIELNRSYVIFICTFDPFGYEQLVYQFENRCVNQLKLALPDETTKIFINTKGTKGKVKAELRELIKVFNGIPGEKGYAKEVSDAIERAKKNREWRKEYMTMVEMEKEIYRKGIEQGITQEAQRIYQEMYANGVPIEQIARMTGCTEDYVRELLDMKQPLL